jgi:cytochrome P450
VGKTLFNADLAHDTREVGATLEILLKLAADFGKSILIPLWVPTPRNLRARLGIRRIEKIIYRIIAQRRAEGDDTGDLLSMLLAVQDEDGSRMTDRQLRDETITLFLAGHETTANALSWTLWLLAQNPEVERKFHAELDAVLGGRPPSVEDMPKLVYRASFIGIHALVSARLGNGAAGSRRGRGCRLQAPSGQRRRLRAMGGAPRPALV